MTSETQKFQLGDTVMCAAVGIKGKVETIHAGEGSYYCTIRITENQTAWINQRNLTPVKE